MPETPACRGRVRIHVPGDPHPFGPVQCSLDEGHEGTVHKSRIFGYRGDWDRAFEVTWTDPVFLRMVDPEKERLRQESLRQESRAPATVSD